MYALTSQLKTMTFDSTAIWSEIPHLIRHGTFFLHYFIISAIYQTLGILNVRLFLSDLCQQRLQ